MKDRVSIDLKDGVADVRLIRADKMNALDPAMFEGILLAGAELANMKGLRAVVLSGEGKAFCAGLDMASFAAMKAQDDGASVVRDLPKRTHGIANRPQQCAWQWRTLPVPVIAAVHGVALGGGFQIMLGADMRYATADTRFSVMEIKWGLVPDLAGTSWDGCTVRHLLDMRAGTRFEEDYTNLDADVRVYEQIYLWRPRVNPDLPADITAYYATLGNERPHGGRFDYRSILTDLLAWVMERAAGARFADLVASELWGPMGAEADAEVTVDGHGNAMADGGICCTLRDLARFGLLVSRDGRRGSEQVIPRAWIQDTLTADPEIVAAFAAAPDAAEFPAGAYYRNQFWVVDPRGPILMASGINGQAVLVHGPADVVIAKFSTWPVAWTARYGVSTRTGLIDLAERVAG